jgi:hypothetical protein
MTVNFTLRAAPDAKDNSRIDATERQVPVQNGSALPTAWLKDKKIRTQ